MSSPGKPLLVEVQLEENDCISEDTEIFRTLRPSQDDYINSDEVYQLLLQCRAFLMADSPLDANDLPIIYLFALHINEKDVRK